MRVRVSPTWHCDLGSFNSGSRRGRAGGVRGPERDVGLDLFDAIRTGAGRRLRRSSVSRHAEGADRGPLVAKREARETTKLVVGDVTPGNFLLGRGCFRRATTAYAIDCNSFQVSLRTPHGYEVYPSGVATEEYAAPEVQPTDWSTSSRTEFSDIFGFGIIAWKLIFNGSHPFAVITPRNVDAPRIGERIEKRQFPFSPGSPLPVGWTAPAVTPSLAVLPVEIRELFFRTFSTADPRDRATAHEWYEVFRAWELVLTPNLPFRILGAWNGSIADRLARTLSIFKPYLGRAFVFVGLVMLTVMTTRFDFSWPSTPSGAETRPVRLHSDPLRTKSNRPRPVDRELFPEPIWNPSPTSKE